MSASIALTVHDAKPLLGSAVGATAEGGMASLDDFKGKPLVVSLWATWCPPCLREMPLLQQAQAAHPEVHFVFLNQGESNAQVQRFLSSHGFGLRNVLLDAKGQAGRNLGGGALPTTVFFDAAGRRVLDHVGELTATTITAALAKLRLSTEGPHPVQPHE